MTDGGEQANRLLPRRPHPGGATRLLRTAVDAPIGAGRSTTATLSTSTARLHLPPHSPEVNPLEP